MRTSTPVTPPRRSYRRRARRASGDAVELLPADEGVRARLHIARSPRRNTIVYGRTRFEHNLDLCCSTPGNPREARLGQHARMPTSRRVSRRTGAGIAYAPRPRQRPGVEVYVQSAQGVIAALAGEPRSGGRGTALARDGPPSCTSSWTTAVYAVRSRRARTWRRAYRVCCFAGTTSPVLTSFPDGPTLPHAQARAEPSRGGRCAGHAPRPPRALAAERRPGDTT
jgi:hypothetical protein